jgi:hypothetical protein
LRAERERKGKEKKGKERKGKEREEIAGCGEKNQLN